MRTDLPVFINDPRFISFAVILLFMFITFFSFLIFKSKIKNQKYLKPNYIITYIFIISLIFSLSFLFVSNFNTIGDKQEPWLTYAFYFSAGLTSIILTIIFLLAIFLLPFRYIYAISFLIEDKDSKKRMINITFFYVLNAVIAILVTCLCYFMKDSFFRFDFNISSLSDFGYTSLYYYARYLFSHVIMTPDFSFYLIIGLIAMITIIYIVMKLFKKYNYRWYVKITNFSNNFVSRFKWQDKIMPLFVFTATSSSLLSQPLATLLHICLIMILFLTFSFIIWSSNWLISYQRLKSYFDFKKIFKILSKNMIKKSSDKQLFDIVFENDLDLTTYKTKQKHTFFYKLLNVCIFPIMITGYLGFCSTGPLLNPITPWSHHLWFWLTLFFVPYILSFAYIFSSASTSSCKMLMNMSTAYIASGFNSGILIYFNPIINKISEYAIFGYQLVFLKPENDLKNKPTDDKKSIRK